MKKRWMALALVLTLCLGLAVPAAADDAAEQQITVNGETYTTVLQALMALVGQEQATIVLESDVQLTSATLVLGSSDYGGMMGGMVITVPTTDITLDLNGYTLTAESGMAAFEIQAGYSLTVIDSSEAQTGQIVADEGIEAVVVEEGGVYIPLGADAEESAEPAVNPFADVAEGDYYYAPVLWAVSQGITTGTTETEFAPDDTCTEAQILTFLWRAKGESEAEIDDPFGGSLDTTAYYYKAACWAYASGMIGTDFAPETPCTRMRAVVFMWISEGRPEAEASSFSDVTGDNDSDFVRSVSWAVAAGVTTGTTADTFSPYDICTRGQIVTFLYRYLAA